MAERVCRARVIGSIRRECLDHVIVFNAAGLRRVVAAYIAYYMRSRTHLALGKDTPDRRPVTPLSAGGIVAIPEVGGLHHRYDRIAA
jgi:hypothetical protein